MQLSLKLLDNAGQLHVEASELSNVQRMTYPQEHLYLTFKQGNASIEGGRELRAYLLGVIAEQAHLEADEHAKQLETDTQFRRDMYPIKAGA
jgi:hypothetical protein